jgi:hypothetical protein
MPIAHECDPPALNNPHAPSFLQARVSAPFPFFLPSSSSSYKGSCWAPSLLSRRWNLLARPYPRSAFATHVASKFISTPLTRSPHRWTMPRFTPKQKRQASACECFVLLPRHFLLDIAQQIGTIASCVRRSTIPAYKFHSRSCLDCEIEHECTGTDVLITVEQLAAMAPSTSRPYMETKLTWAERQARR